MSDVLVIGAGMVGLAAAQRFALAGHQVTVVDRCAPDMSNEGLVARVSAINPRTARFLAPVWEAVERKAVVRAMHVWDETAEIDFDADKLGLPWVSTIVENRALVKVLMAQKQFELLTHETPLRLVEAEAGVSCELASGHCVDAQLVVAADGAHSWVRQQLGIITRERPYGHTALVAVIETDEPHDQTALQVFMADGVLGLLPLSAPNQFAIVWSAVSHQYDNLGLDLATALDWRLGECRVLTEPQEIPLVMRHASQYVKGRCVLLGDAAHTIHPLAGQGVNLGLMDVACLIETLGGKLYAPNLLRRFERERKAENQKMLLAMDVFKEVFGSENTFVKSVRQWGLGAVNRMDCVKRWFVNQTV